MRVKAIFENILKQRGLSDDKFAELVAGMYDLLGSFIHPNEDKEFAECRVISDGKIECKIEKSVYEAMPIDVAYLAIVNGNKGEKRLEKRLERKVRWFAGIWTT